MTNKQFKEIRDMAWDWWCKNMLDWAANTIKDIEDKLGIGQRMFL